MYYCFDGVNVFYERQKGVGLPVLLLHGWGCSNETLRPVFNYYAALNREVVAVDFPPFGKSDAPDESYTVYRYAELITALLRELKIEKFDLFCHSFGARVAALICQNAGVRTLVITGGAGLKPRFSPVKFCKIKAYKIRKRLGLGVGKRYGSSDYNRLSDGMKRVFVSVVNTHLDDEFERIRIPTLLLWGEKDGETPLYMARRMKRLIRGSRLVILKNSGHFAFLDDTRSFLMELSSFYGGVN